MNTKLTRTYIDQEPETIADFWDCEIEHSERGQSQVNQHLLYIIRRNAGRFNLTNLDVEAALRDMATKQAIHWEWEINDKVLDFNDGSRLGLIAMDAGTAAGSSRIMKPGESGARRFIRGGLPYIHGHTRTAWYWTRISELNRNLTWGITDNPCPLTGVWVRRLCNQGCADLAVYTQRITAGTNMPPCPTCKSPTNFGWATP